MHPQGEAMHPDGATRQPAGENHLAGPGKTHPVVVTLSSAGRVSARAHNQATWATLARALASLLGCDFAGEYDPLRRYPGPVYFLPGDTLLCSEASTLGIRTQDDLFSGPGQVRRCSVVGILSIFPRSSLAFRGGGNTLTTWLVPPVPSVGLLNPLLFPVLPTRTSRARGRRAPRSGCALREPLSGGFLMLGLLGTICRRSSRPPARSLPQVEELEPRLVMSTAPKVILISLDGAAPYIENPLIAQGLLPGSPR
jgi:hypothetical protein